MALYKNGRKCYNAHSCGRLIKRNTARNVVFRQALERGRKGTLMKRSASIATPSYVAYKKARRAERRLHNTRQKALRVAAELGWEVRSKPDGTLVLRRG